MFADKLISLRKSKQITQEELAKVLFVSRSAVAKWEQGRSNPDAETLKKIANYFSMSLNELIDDTEIVLVENYSGDSVYASFYNRINVLLASEEYDKCNEILEIILNKDINQVEAYLYKIVIEYRLHSIDDLYTLSYPLDKDKYFNFAYEVSNEEEKKKLDDLLRVTKDNFIKKNNEKLYNLALIEEKQNNFERAKEYYRILNGYRDSNERIEQIINNDKKKYYDKAISFFISHCYEKALYYFSYIKDFRDSEDYVKKCNEIILEKANALSTSNKISDLKKAKTMYQALSNIDNDKINKINNKITTINRKKDKIALITCLSIVVIAIGSTCTAIGVSKAKEQEAIYNNCIDLLNNWELYNAKEEASKLTNKKDKNRIDNLIEIFYELRGNDYKNAVKLSLDSNIPVEAVLSYSEFKDSEIYEFKSYDDINKMPVPEILYYYFNGYKLSSFRYVDEKVTMNLDADIRCREYKISYLYDNNCSFSNQFVKTYTVNTKTFSLPFLFKKGYVFNGWKIDNKVIKEFDPSLYMKDVELVADFSIVTYKIIYELDGGENSPQNVETYTINDDKILLYEPTKSGFAFKGWSQEENSQVYITEFSGGECKNMHLYANWANASYQVTYVLNGGTNSNENISVFSYEMEQFTLRKPTKEGYVFVGWYRDEEYTSICSQLTNDTMNDITLYAKWKVEYAYIQYNLSEDAINNPKNIERIRYDDLSEKTLYAPHRTGYLFNGWYYNNKKVTSLYYYSGEIINLEPRWIKRIITDSYVQVDSDLFGDGTLDDPFQIHDIYEWAYIGELTKSSSSSTNAKYETAHYILVNDIDMMNRSFIPWFNLVSGGTIVCFRGVFDGNNHKIYNFQDDSYQYLFKDVAGYFGVEPVLKNLTIEFQNKKFDNVTDEFFYNRKYYSDITIQNCNVTCLNS